MRKWLLMALTIMALLVVGGCAGGGPAAKAISQPDFIADTGESGVTLSPFIEQLNGQRVRISGFVGIFSPVDDSFFYLVRKPEITCAFCVGTEPADQVIITVYLPKGKIAKYDTSSPYEITGTLHIGRKEDPSGMANYLNILDATFKPVK